jgi:putative transposase
MTKRQQRTGIIARSAEVYTSFIPHSNRPAAAILSCDAESRLQDHSRRRLKPIRIRHQYLNNRIEQDHSAIKRCVRPMLGFKSVDSARVILSGIELIHMMRKGQAKCVRETQPSLVEQFEWLAG